MKIADQEIEVNTQRYHGGWMSVAYLPGGKQVASAPWNTREAAENDVYQQALMQLAPMPQFDPGKTYEAITQQRADSLLPAPEKNVPLPPEPSKADLRRKPKSPWPEYLLKLEPGDSFVVPYSTSQHVMTMAKYMGIPLTRQEIKRERPARAVAWADMKDWSARDPSPLMVRIWRLQEPQSPSSEPSSLVPPKASFYPSDGGSAGGGGGITSV